MLLLAADETSILSAFLLPSHPVAFLLWVRLVVVLTGCCVLFLLFLLPLHLLLLLLLLLPLLLLLLLLFLLLLQFWQNSVTLTSVRGLLIEVT